jgi:ribosomal protein L37AE/L43A
MSDNPKPVDPVETFDDLPEVMICPKCDGWRHWQSMEGNWHCAKCNPPTKGLFWMKQVERARRRHHKPIRPETKQLIADIQELVQQPNGGGRKPASPSQGP